MRRAVFLDRDGVLNRGVTKGDRPFAPSRSMSSKSCQVLAQR
jgi:hypothetical protein